MYFQERFQTGESTSRSNVSCMRYQTQKNSVFASHCHMFYELTYVIKGERREISGERHFETGENTLVFIPCLSIHSCKNISDADLLVIQFSDALLGGNAPSSFSGRTLLQKDPARPFMQPKKDGAVYNVLMKLAESCQRDGVESKSLSDELRENARTIELIAALLDENFLTVADSRDSLSKIPALDKVINHILSHPDEKTDMKEAARIANMSYYNFSRSFKDVIGIGFSDYCTAMRLVSAEELLLGTDMTVADVAQRVGIDIPSYFSRLFKSRTGLSPQEFRRKNTLSEHSEKSGIIPS